MSDGVWHMAGQDLCSGWSNYSRLCALGLHPWEQCLKSREGYFAQSCWCIFFHSLACTREKTRLGNKTTCCFVNKAALIHRAEARYVGRALEF